MSLPLSACPAAKTAPRVVSSRIHCQRAVARAVQVGCDPGPIDVHVDRERGGRRVRAEPPLLAHGLRERQTAAAQFDRHREHEIPGLAQFLEIFSEERVLAIVPGARSANRASISLVSSASTAGATVGVIGRHQRIRRTTPWDSS